MRIIGLDYGTKTVGVALSDALGITAQPVETITRKEENKLRKTYARIEAIIEENDVEKIVVGLLREEQGLKSLCGTKDLQQFQQRRHLWKAA